MIITDKILTANQFAEYYSGKYYTPCDTFEETRNCLANDAKIYIGEGFRFTELTDTDITVPGKAFVVVSFSSKDDYTKYEYRIMRIQKRYLFRFMKNMNDDEI